MKLSEAARYYEKCMKHLEESDCGSCPLYKVMTLELGDRPGDAHGKITWKIQGCSMMAYFETWLKSKKPGQPIEIEKTEGKDATSIKRS
jgi:Zn-finger protein